MFSCNVLRSFTRWVAVAGVAVGLASTSAFADSVNVFLTARSGSGEEVGVAVNLLDVGTDVKVTAEVQDIPGFTPGSGDIMSLWFDVASTVNLANVTHASPYDPPSLEFNITGFIKGHNSVGTSPFTGSGSAVNINGIDPPFNANYDMVIKFGTNGATPDFYPKVSFMFTNLTVADLVGGRIASRVMSIGTSGDSGKYANWVPPPDNPPVVPTPSAALGGLALLGFAGFRRRKMA